VAERLTLARQQKLPHQDFLELVLSDEVSRRDRVSGDYRARVAQLDPAMRMEAWDPQTEVAARGPPGRQLRGRAPPPAQGRSAHP
jgi:hypothetical protein